MTTVTALCLSMAEYCCPVWARSTHRKLDDTTLNETWRLITGCIRPTAMPTPELLPSSTNYQNYCLKTRTKLSSRNNLLTKLHRTNWGACPHTIMTTVTALCLSMAEYCCPVWARSTHRKLDDTTLNETCRLITGCIRPTAMPTPELRHRPTRNKSRRSQPERAHQTTHRAATQPLSPVRE